MEVGGPAGDGGSRRSWRRGAAMEAKYLKRRNAGPPPARGIAVCGHSPRAQAICLTPAERPVERIVTSDAMRLRQ